MLKPGAGRSNRVANNDWMKRDFTSKKSPTTKWIFAPSRCATTQYEFCTDLSPVYTLTCINYWTEHASGTTRVVQASKNITEKRMKWYGHVRRMKEEHIVRRMLDVNIPGKRRRGRPNLRWKDACKRDMTEVGLKEDNTTNRAAWRNKIISYTGDPR